MWKMNPRRCMTASSRSVCTMACTSRSWRILPSRVRIEAQGEEHVIEPALARLITAARAPADQRRPRSYMALSALGPGDVCAGHVHFAVVPRTAAPATDGSRDRTGNTHHPGTRQSSPANPRAYLVRGTLVALRREQADQIFVTPVRGAA